MSEKCCKNCSHCLSNECTNVKKQIEAGFGTENFKRLIVHEEDCCDDFRKINNSHDEVTR